MATSGWLYVVCGLIAVLGRILGHTLSAWNEAANRKRQYRIERLADAWRSIQIAANDTTTGAKRILESALADVQLFGTLAQVTAATRVELALEIASERTPALLELLEGLRGDLRREMRLGRHVTPLVTIEHASRSDALHLPQMAPRRPLLSLVGAGRRMQRSSGHSSVTQAPTESEASQ
jgi:hypothetical protein